MTLVEALAPTNELLDALHGWMSGDAESAEHGSDAQCDAIIAMSRNYPPNYRGILYRGTAIPDDLALALQRGETVTLPPLSRKLISWTKDIHIAEMFADNMVYDRRSCALIQVTTDDLSLVVDFDLLYDARPETGHESEILAYNRPIVITRQNVVSLWVPDPDGGDVEQVI